MGKREFDPLANDNILDWSKFKGFANDALIVTHMIRFLSLMKDRKHFWKKEEILVLRIFSFFDPQYFQKDSSSWSLKLRIVWNRVIGSPGWITHVGYHIILD